MTVEATEIQVHAAGSTDPFLSSRAFLAPTFTPIDDARIFERMHTMLRGLMDEYRFSAVNLTDSTTHFTAVHAEGMDVDGRGDLLHPGFHLRNSEVGASALSLDDHWLRLVCTNGLMVRVGGKRALYRTHRAIEDDQFAAALVIAVGPPRQGRRCCGALGRCRDRGGAAGRTHAPGLGHAAAARVGRGRARVRPLRRTDALHRRDQGLRGDRADPSAPGHRARHAALREGPRSVRVRGLSGRRGDGRQGRRGRRLRAAR